MEKPEQIAAAMMGIYARTDPSYLAGVSKEMRKVENAIESSVVIEISPEPKVTGYVRVNGERWKRATVSRLATMTEAAKSLFASEQPSDKSV